jgi:hypothetical protein
VTVCTKKIYSKYPLKTRIKSAIFLMQREKRRERGDEDPERVDFTQFSLF